MDKKSWISTRVQDSNRARFYSLRKLYDAGSRLAQTVDLGLGDPAFDTPEKIREAAKNAIDEGVTHYQPTHGMPELLEAISEKLMKENNVEVNPKSDIVVTLGGTEGIFVAMQAFINPGDEVLIPNPTYMAFPHCIKLAGGTVVSVPIKEENKFRVDPLEIEKRITPRTKMIVIVTPDNPTGSATSCDMGILESIAEIARKHNIIVFSDEMYEKFIYDGRKHYSIASLPGMKSYTITLGGFSKAYAMTGWRLGYIYGDQYLINPLSTVHSAISIGAPAFTQKAAITALQGPIGSDIIVKHCERMRDSIMDYLKKIPEISCVKPDGSIFVFPNIAGFGMNSVEFSSHLLSKYGTIVTPGVAFGSGGEGYIRLCSAKPQRIIETAMERMLQATDHLRQS